MRPVRYSINVTLDGCCDHRAFSPDEDLHRHAAENLAFVAASLIGPLALAARTLNGQLVDTKVLVGSSVVLFMLVLARMVGLLRNVEEQVHEIDKQSRALVLSEARHRFIVEAVNEVVFETDESGRWSLLTPAWTRLTGKCAPGVDTNS